VAAPATSQRWLFGPARDLLLGCGLGYMLVFAALCFVGPFVRTQSPQALAPLILLLVGAPHYGATLLRVYERRSDRRTYALFAVWTTLALALVFVGATRLVWLGSWVLTVYITWNPWHYAGQNYGLTLMFLRRREVPVDASLKRWIHASFVLTFALTFLVLHREQGTAAFSPLLYQDLSYTFRPLGIPALLSDALLLLGLAAYVVSLAVTATRLLRLAGPATLLPAALLVATQSLWFTVPLACRSLGVLQGVEPLSAKHGIYYFYWAAVGHSVQYVWVTSYYARRSEGWSGYGPFLLKAQLAGTALWTVPALLFAPGLLGRLPFDMGLGSLVAATVNLHHFILDGAIWKLRDGRIARVLLRAESAPRAGPEPVAPARAWRGLAPAVYAAGALSLAVTLLHYVEQERVRRGVAAGDSARVESAVARLAWLGRESPDLIATAGQLREARGDLPGARARYEESVALFPTPRALRLAADLYERQGDLPAALEAWMRVVELLPDRARPHYRVGALWLEQGDPARALGALGRAAELDPESALYREALERARAQIAADGRAVPPEAQESGGDAAAAPAGAGAADAPPG
jgi:hypothetical protein